MITLLVNKSRLFNAGAFIAGISLVLMVQLQNTTAAQLPVTLGSAATCKVLAGSTVTSTGATVVNGDLGLSPGTAVVGFPPGIVNGTIHAADAAAALAQSDLTIAYDDAAGRTQDVITVAGDLGGLVLTQGLYNASSSLSISTGDLTLDAQGSTNAVWIFQMGSTLTTASSRQIFLTGGARAANVFWQIGSSATLGTATIFKGTIMADQSITMNTGATMDGRALARHGAVTLDANTIAAPRTMALVSAPVVAGPYADTAGQSVNLAAGTITAATLGVMQFYGIRSDRALVIADIHISGGVVVITCNPALLTD